MAQRFARGEQPVAGVDLASELLAQRVQRLLAHDAVGAKPLAERIELAFAPVIVVGAARCGRIATALDDEVGITLRPRPEAAKDIEKLAIDVDVAFARS